MSYSHSGEQEAMLWRDSALWRSTFAADTEKLQLSEQPGQLSN